MDGDFFFIGLFIWVLSLIVFYFIIRKAIDGSNSSKKMDILIEEIRILRKEIKNSKHIIDKKV